MKHWAIKNKWLLVIIGISVLARLISSFVLGNDIVNLPGTYDQISYHTLALRVLNGNGFSFGELWWPITQANQPTAHWSYLYTLYLVAVYMVFGPNPLAARIIQAVVVGVLQPYLAYKIGCAVFSHKTGLVSAGIMAVYAYFIYYAAALMTESFFISFVMGGLLLTIQIGKKHSIPGGEKKKISFKMFFLLGICFGSAILLRQLFLLIIPFLYLWIIWVKRRSINRRLISGFVLSAILILIMILPFTVFNYLRFNRFVLLNTNSGYALFWANHPVYGNTFIPILPPEMGSYESLIPDELRSLDEAALEQALLKIGVDFVLQDPGRYVLLSLSRIPAYFMFWPSPESGLVSNISRVGSFGVFLPFMVFGLFKALQKQKGSLTSRLESPLFLLVIFITIYTSIHLLTWALIRYRLPVDAVLVIFAGYAIVEIYAWVKKKRTLNPAQV